MGEIGVTYRPTGDRGLSVDVGVQGYVGKREGVSGSLRVGWSF
jgi:hypothetical protein